MNILNFNSHPELSDQEFAIAATSVFNGITPAQVGNPVNAIKYIQQHGGGAAGRYALIYDPSSGWLAQGYSGNADDNWFLNVPSWAWAIVIPAALITAAYLAWRAWGGKVKEAMRGEGGSSSGY